MFGRDAIKATVEDLHAAAARGADAADPAVSAGIAACVDALASWEAEGSRLPAVEGVLQAANGLLDALHDANPEGLPFGVRDPAVEMQTLLDEAEEEGFTVKASPPPAP